MDDKPRIKTVAHDDLQALFDSAPRHAAGTTVRSRRSKERPKAVKSSDGRRLRSKGRDKQFNTNVTPDLFERMADACERFDLTKAEFTELAFNAAIALLKTGGVEGLQNTGGDNGE